MLGRGDGREKTGRTATDDGDFHAAKLPNPAGKPKRVRSCSLPMWKQLRDQDRDRIVEMAWEDRTPFEAIEVQFGLKENEVRALMRQTLKRRSFELWRKRVKGRLTKHRAARPTHVTRFRSANQRSA